MEKPLGDSELAELIRGVYRDMQARSVSTPPEFAEAIAKRRSELFVLFDPPVEKVPLP